MNPYLVLVLAAALVALPLVAVVVRRERRARGTANDHLPGQRRHGPPQEGAGLEGAMPHAARDMGGLSG